MSQIAVNDGALSHTSKDGRCIYCGCQLKACEVCGDWFRAGRIDNVICGDGCRTAKSRSKIREDLDLDDE